MFFDRVCTVGAIDIFGWIPGWGTTLGDAAEGTLAVAEGGPIPILLLYVQHLCQLEMRDGEVSEAARTRHFLAPVLLYLAGTLLLCLVEHPSTTPSQCFHDL